MVPNCVLSSVLNVKPREQPTCYLVNQTAGQFINDPIVQRIKHFGKLQELRLKTNVVDGLVVNDSRQHIVFLVNDCRTFHGCKRLQYKTWL